MLALATVNVTLIYVELVVTRDSSPQCEIYNVPQSGEWFFIVILQNTKFLDKCITIVRYHTLIIVSIDIWTE